MVEIFTAHRLKTNFQFSAANNNHVERSGSGDSIRRNRNWKFYRHREPEPQAQPVLLISKNISPVQYRTAARMNDDVSAFIYRTSDLGAADKQGDLYIQDIADTTEYSILDPAKLHMRTYTEKVNHGQTFFYISKGVEVTEKVFCDIYNSSLSPSSLLKKCNQFETFLLLCSPMSTEKSAGHTSGNTSWKITRKLV